MHKENRSVSLFGLENYNMESHCHILNITSVCDDGGNCEERAACGENNFMSLNMLTITSKSNINEVLSMPQCVMMVNQKSSTAVKTNKLTSGAKLGQAQ